MKTMTETFLTELEQEAVITRKMLGRLPEDKFSWQPHPKSMTLQQLATHIAELPGWIPMGIGTDELDFAENHYEPRVFDNTSAILEDFEKNQAAAIETLRTTDETELDKTWTMRSGDTVYKVYTKAEVIRVALNQTTHHRAQLGVYLRLLDIPVPASYGPSADEQLY